jgi:hypothetical protein
MRLTRYVAVSSLAIGLAALPPTASQTTVAAQEGGQSAAVTTQEVTPASGFFTWSGGGVRGMRARTQTAAQLIGSPGAWVGVSNALIAWTVPSGTADTFDVSFIAECAKLFGGRARIRVIDTVSGGTSSLEPNDGDVTFCSGTTATNHASWTKRVGAGTHNLQVQVNNSAGQTVIDDWKMRLVVYD